MCEVMEMLKQEGEVKGEAIGEARGEARGEVIGEAKGYAKFQRRLALLIAKINEAGDVVNLQALTDSEEFEEYCKRYGVEE